MTLYNKKNNKKNNKKTITLFFAHFLFILQATVYANTNLDSLLIANYEAEQEQSGWIDQARKKVDKWSVDLKNSFGEGKEISKAKLEQGINEFMQNMQQFEQAGFRITRLYISVGLVPAVTFQIEQLEELTEQEKKALLDYYQDSFVFTYTLKSLFKATELKVNGFELKAVRIRISLNPSAIALMEPL